MVGCYEDQEQVDPIAIKIRNIMWGCLAFYTHDSKAFCDNVPTLWLSDIKIKW